MTNTYENYEKGRKKNDTFIVADEQHIEINSKSGGKDTISFNEDFTDLTIEKEGLNLVIKKNGNSKSATVLNYFSADGKSTSSSIKYLQVGSTPETTKIIDILNSGIINSEITEFARDKKGKINGSLFSDTITGTDLADNIVAGGGNDTITGGQGNDTITGGTGANTINYTFDANNGNDVINLTKGENLTIKIDSLTNIKYEYSSNKKDLIIYKEKIDGEYVKSITLKNFANKDVTNNSTKNTENTSSVILTDGETKVDLRNDRYLVGSSKILTEKNFTGTWLSEEINAKDLDEKFDKKGNLLPYSSKGLTLDGKGGNDKIYGSDYSDTIKGGDGKDEIYGEKGNDIITGGTGENYIGHYFYQGNDVINLTKGENLTIALLDSSLTISKVGFEFVNKNRDLKIYNKENESQYITIKNFVAKDVTNNSNTKKGIEDTSSVELVLGENDPIDLREHLYNINATKSYTGSWLNEEIDATSAPLGKKNKGVAIKGNGGDDKITGSTGNDTITGGIGKNTINYTTGNGNDVINLTKGENLTLSLTNISSLEDITFKFVKKDLRIYTSENEYITLKNFAGKDVTNNGNAKKGIEDRSSVELLLNGSEKPIDLREYLFTVDNLTKNYTGTWLNEDINTEEYKKYDKKGELIKDNTQKGLSLNGKNGDDVITGSIYSDTIKGGNDNDTIIGGYGNDKLYGEAGENTFVFYNGETNSHDTIYSGKGEDTINFAYGEEEVDNFSLADIKFEQVKNTKGVGTKDLKISYGDGNTVTVKDFYTIDKKGNITGVNSKASVKSITTQEDTFNLKEFLSDENNIILGTKDNNPDIKGTENNDLIITGAGDDIVQSSAGDDKVYLGAGNDEIFSYAGNNKIYAGSGRDRIYGNANSGNDTVYGQDGNDYIDYANTKSEIVADGGAGDDNLKINYGTAIGGLGKDEIRISDFSQDATIYGDLTLEDDIKQTQGDVDSLYGSDGANTIYGGGGDDIINGSGGADIIYGGAGNDNITTGTKDGGIEESDVTEVYGDDGSDSIVLQGYKNIVSGGIGNDFITGYNTGEDIFVYKKGDGTDYIEGGDSSGKTDAIKFTDETTINDLNVSLDGDNLIIQYSNNIDDKIIIKNYLKYGSFNSSIDKIIFADGTEKAIKTDLNLTIYIDEETTSYTDNALSNIIVGSDTTSCIIKGGLGNDTIVSGKANDVIYGDEGANTYTFNANSGTDIVYSSSGLDTIKIDGVSLQAMTTTVNGNDVEITNSVYPTDKIIVKDYLNSLVNITIEDNSGNTTSLIEKLEDAGIIVGDGEINGNDEANRILGSDNSDTITGKKGNDILNGGKGSDTYIFADGDGDDIVSNSTDGETDTLKFTDSTKEELSYAINGNDLVISHNDGADSVTVKDYFADENTVTDLTDSTGETFKIADVNKLVIAEADSIEGTKLNDVINLTTGDHTVKGGNGNDTITLSTGNDVIEGNEGNDVINMGTGEATLVFRNGDGHDIIYMNELDTVEDKLQFIDTEYYDIKYELKGDDMILWHDKDVNNNFNSSVTIKDYAKYYDPATDKMPVLNNIYDKNGYTYSQQNILFQFKNEIENYNPAEETVNGTKFKDIIHTYDITETIYAGYGDDTIYGRSGNDGEDKVYGEAGNDAIYYENSNQEVLLDGGIGNDTIRINYGTAIGGLGNDEIRVSSYSSGVTIYGDLTPTDDAEQTQGDKDLIVGGYGGSDGQDQTGGDTIYAGGGDDRIIGNGGSDLIYGGTGKDTIYGYRGEGTKNLNEGVIFEAHGGTGDDVIYAQSETNNIYGDAGNDVIYAYTDQHTTIQDSEGTDVINLLDTEAGEANHDLLNIVFNVSKDYKVSSGIEFADIVLVDNTNLEKWISSETYAGVTVKNNTVETINFSDGASITSAETAERAELIANWLTANNFDDVKTALNSNTITNEQKEELLSLFKANILSNTTENETINGTDENDIFVFNDGNNKDTIISSGENDTIYFKEEKTLTFTKDLANSNDLIISYNNNDSITLKDYFVSNSHSANKIQNGNNIIDIATELQNGLNIVGTANADNITGTTGNDTINGGSGANGGDTINGEAGDDKINYGNVTDTVYIDGGIGNDTININYGTAIGGLGNDSITLTDESTGATIYGDLTLEDDAEQTQGGDDIIRGNKGTNYQRGKDTIYAGGGNDKVYGLGGSDLIYGGAGNDTIYSYDEGKNKISQATFKAYGGTGNDAIYAHCETNYVYGDEGNDTIQAYTVYSTTIEDSEGNDTLYISNITSEATKANHDNLNIIFNVSQDYKIEDGINFGDIVIVEDSQLGNWVAGSNYTGINIKDNAVELIYSNDNYYISSTQIAELAQDVATWLTSDDRDYQDVTAALKDADDKALLLEFIADNTNWSQVDI